MTQEEIDTADTKALAEAVPVPPSNLRVEMWPHPHLRDDAGCVLAGDCINFGRVAFTLAAVEAALQSTKEG